jgi:hypothetical protein
MIIFWQEDAIVFRGLDSYFEDLLVQLPESADPNDPASRSRLFGTPTGGRDREADAEWRELNDPELRSLFQSHIDVVADDLKKLSGGPEERELSIPLEHLPAWIHTLNQARLAIAARHGFTEDDIEGRHEPADLDTEMVLSQLEHYANILGFLLRHTDL